jgi:hypothetical protein
MAIYKLNSNRKLKCHQMPNTQFAERVCLEPTPAQVGGGCCTKDGRLFF